MPIRNANVNATSFITIGPAYRSCPLCAKLRYDFGIQIVCFCYFLILVSSSCVFEGSPYYNVTRQDCEGRIIFISQQTLIHVQTAFGTCSFGKSPHRNYFLFFTLFKLYISRQGEIVYVLGFMKKNKNITFT